MKPAALGVQMHSGWGVLVAVSADPVEMLARRRIVSADPEIPGDHSALSLRSQPRTPGAGEAHFALHSVLICAWRQRPLRNSLQN